MPFCANCGREISELAVACPNCGHPGPGAAARPPAYAPAPYGQGMAPFGRPLATWGSRVGASLLDAIIVGVPAMLLVLALGFFGGTRVDPATGELSSEGAGALLGAMLIVLGAGILYRVLLEGGQRGQTVGKMALNIRVCDVSTGGSIGYGRAFLRWLVASILWAVLYIPGIVDVLFPLWDPKRQTIHDKAARSVVVVAG